jgi:hypothetical protein
MNTLKKIGGLAGLLFIMPSCDFVACPAIYDGPSLEVSPNSSIVIAPSALVIKSNGRVQSGCNNFQATAVAFYANGARIGYDNSAPFEMTWNLQPGQDGIPASESSTSVKLVAITNLSGLDESRVHQMQVNVARPLPR